MARVLLLRPGPSGQLPRGLAGQRGERGQGEGGLRRQGQGQRGGRLRQAGMIRRQ